MPTPPIQVSLIPIAEIPTPPIQNSFVPLAGMPTPPDDTELWWYLRNGNQWPQAAMLLSFLFAAASLIHFSLSSPWLYPFLILLAINLFSSALSVVSGFNRRRVNAANHNEKLALWRDYPPLTFPNVDIFLPCCGEDLDVLRNTYYYTSLVTWPGDITVWVLDDGDQPEVQELAAEFGFKYVVRPDRGVMKKAGNLRNAFETTAGEFIVILDADFCPRADFLFHTIPYFDDAAIGIVQTPQFFSTETSMNWLERTAGATQELFYRWIQPSRDRAGAPVCVGSCAVYRRSALAAAGGFAQIEHSEDVHTGISLLAAGFTTRYVAVLVSRGLCPNDLGGFLNQQYRWCNGSITLLTSGAAQSRELTLWQRSCFWAGFLYYISTAINVLTASLPILVMVLFFPQEIRAINTLLFLPGMFVLFVVLPRASVSRWRFEVMRVQMAFSFAHAVALGHKLLGRTAGWVPTGAVGKKNQLTRTIALLGLITIAASTLPLAAGLIRDICVHGPNDFWALEVFFAAYCYLALPLGWDFYRVFFPRPGVPSSAARTERTIIKPSLSPYANSTKTGQLSVPHALRNTALIIVAGLAFSGWFSGAIRVAFAGGDTASIFTALGLTIRTAVHSLFADIAGIERSIMAALLPHLGSALLALAFLSVVVLASILGWRSGFARKRGQATGAALAGVAAIFAVPFIADSALVHGWRTPAILLLTLGLTSLGVLFGTSDSRSHQSDGEPHPVRHTQRAAGSIALAASLLPSICVAWNAIYGSSLLDFWR